MDLYRDGILKRYNVELIGAQVDAINKAEDREKFKEAMDGAGISTAKGGFINTWKEAKSYLEQINFPIIIRPSFTLGGTGGSVAYNYEEFQSLIEKGLNASPINEVLIEESLLGWKEFELEVIRDKVDNLSLIHI